MEVAFSDSFRRAFRKRIYQTVFEQGSWSRLDLFVEDPFDNRLKTHRFFGKLKDLWSFTVAPDVRVVFYFTKGKPRKAVFVDIGKHDEVY